MSIDFTNDKPSILGNKPRLVVNNALQFGGKEPPSDNNWLSNLLPGDVFLARHHSQAEKNFELNQFCVMFKTEKSVKLRVYLNENEKMIRWVEPSVFSKEMIFQEVIGFDDGSTAEE